MDTQIILDRCESSKRVWNYIPGVFRKTFVSPYEQFADRVGQAFRVIRELDDSERDPEVGPMYRIRFEDGFETDAWGEEVCVADARA